MVYVSVYFTLIKLSSNNDIQWEVFTGSTEDPEHPHQVATLCYGAAVFYVALTAFCTCQVRCFRPISVLNSHSCPQLGVHSRVAKGGNIQL